MNHFSNFVKKEFLHIFRDFRTILMLIAMPVVQMIIFGFAITNEIKNTPFGVLDESKSNVSARLINKINGSMYFKLSGYYHSSEEIETAFRQGKIKTALIIPSGFGNDLYHVGTADVQMLADASDPNEASTVAAYARQIIMQFQQEEMSNHSAPYLVRPEMKMLYNPQLKSAYNFVPGIMGMILMLICAMMTSISVVREKEQGTMEILLVSPIKPLYVILSKTVPYFLVAMIDVVCILLLSTFLLDVTIAGNIVLILFLSMTFTLSALSLGLLISSVTNSQQAALLVSGVGLILPAMLLSGVIFPIENMPLILQALSNLIPAKWFTSAIKDVMIKGLGLSAIWKEFSVLAGMTIFLLVFSVKRFKNRL